MYYSIILSDLSDLLKKNTIMASGKENAQANKTEKDSMRAIIKTIIMDTISTLSTHFASILPQSTSEYNSHNVQIPWPKFDRKPHKKNPLGRAGGR